MAKKNLKINIAILSLILAVICGVTYCITDYYQAQYASTQAVVRTIDAKPNEIDYQSILNDFEDAKLETEGSLTTFEGVKSLTLEDFEELDNLSESEKQFCESISVKYNFSFDSESNIVTIAAETRNNEKIIEIEEIFGVAFYNKDGEIDAVMNIDGEGILLSEMQDKGLIQNCGWFKKVLKKVVKVVAVVAIVVAVAAVVVATVGAAAPAVVAAGVGVAAVGTASVLTTTCLTVAMVAAGVSLASIAVASIDFEGVNYVLEEYTKVADKLVKGCYYLAVGDKEGRMLVSPIRISTAALASLALQSGLSIYTPIYTDAEYIATLASNGLKPVWDPAHQNKYFAHYHLATRPKPSTHAFYGIPTTKGSYF